MRNELRGIQARRSQSDHPWLGQHAESGAAPDGRLFSGVRGGELPTITDRRAWTKARQMTPTAAEQASPLARRPDDLRQACLSHG